MAEESISTTLGQLEQAHDPALEQKREEMRGNIMEYEVKKGETIASIARDNDINDYHDIVALNRLFLDRALKTSGKNETKVFIKPKDKIFIPKDLKKFQADIESIRKIAKAMLMNERVAKEDVAALKGEMNERIFPGFRQSIGMNRLNDGLLGNMRVSLHLDGPRQVDTKYEHGASCAHYFRQEIRSAFNIGDMSNEWKKFMNTGNIDAWELPVHLLNIKNDNGKHEFVQKANFMDFFDTSKFGDRTSPVPTTKEKEYAQAMVKLNKELENNPNAINSAIPVYYRYSDYQLRGI